MEGKPVRLQFKKLSKQRQNSKHPREGLSALVKVGKHIFLACDEGVNLERLQKKKKGYSKHKTFSLANYLPLPDKKKSEVDIEGLDFENNYLWITGSHSLKRQQPDDKDSLKAQLKDLGKVIREPNRFVLARIPLVKGQKSGKYKLHKTCSHPDKPKKKLTAAYLGGGKKTNQLIKALKKDPHLKEFLDVPGKDNGFDIEGLAMDGDRIFLGLRGPVLRGWAMVLELKTKLTPKNKLKLKKIGPDGERYKKHFLDLAGMGIRDLTPAGKDLLILAGPTMELDGTIAVYRWKKAFKRTKQSKKSLVPEKRLKRRFDIPHGTGENAGRDRAEGITLISNHQLLVVYDSPSPLRTLQKGEVVADIFPLDGDNKKR